MNHWYRSKRRGELWDRVVAASAEFLSHKLSQPSFLYQIFTPVVIENRYGQQLFDYAKLSPGDKDE